MHARLRLALPLLALGVPAARAVAATPLRIAFDAASAPTMYTDAQGGAAGVYPAIVRHAFALMNEPAELVAEPFRRLIATLFGGTGAAGGVVRNEERLAVADYSGDYFVENLSLFRRAGAPELPPGIAGLRGLHIGVVRGWSYGDAFDRARAQHLFEVEEVDTDSRNFGKLRLNRLDAVVATELAGRMLLGAEAAGTIAPLAQPLLSMGIALAVPKTLSAKPLLQRFDQAIATMRRDGSLEAIVASEVEHARRLLPAS